MLVFIASRLSDVAARISAAPVLPQSMLAIAGTAQIRNQSSARREAGRICSRSSFFSPALHKAWRNDPRSSCSSPVLQISRKAAYGLRKPTSHRRGLGRASQSARQGSLHSACRPPRGWQDNPCSTRVGGRHLLEKPIHCDARASQARRQGLCCSDGSDIERTCWRDRRVSHPAGPQSERADSHRSCDRRHPHAPYSSTRTVRKVSENTLTTNSPHSQRTRDTLPTHTNRAQTLNTRSLTNPRLTPNTLSTQIEHTHKRTRNTKGDACAQRTSACEAASPCAAGAEAHHRTHSLGFRVSRFACGVSGS
jgi:hypothetical protein